MNEDTFSVILADGTKKEYGYSPEFREDMQNLRKQVSLNNFILFGIIVFLFLCLLAACLIYFQTGIVGRYLANGVCPI